MIIFPGFHIHTVTFRYGLVCACVFAAMKGAQIMNPTVEWPCIEYTFGAKYTYAIQNKYEIWRLIVPMVMHGAAVHSPGTTSSMICTLASRPCATLTAS